MQDKKKVPFLFSFFRQRNRETERQKNREIETERETERVTQKSCVFQMINTRKTHPIQRAKRRGEKKDIKTPTKTDPHKTHRHR